MFIENKKLKVVIIDFPILILNDSYCADLLGKVLKMKYDGYAFTYNDSVLPMDKTDFFGTHMLLCEDTGKELIPIFAYKSVTLDRCNKFNFEFPIFPIVRNDCHPQCLADLNKLIASIPDPSSVSYDSSLAKNLEYRLSGDQKLKIALQEITMMMIVKHHTDFNIPHMINCGGIKVKTDVFFLKLGLNKLNEHAHFNQKYLNNEESVVFYNNSFSFEAHRMAKKYKKLWDNKLVINGNTRAVKISNVA